MKDTILNLSKKLIRIKSTKGNTEAFNEILHLVQEELDDYNVKPFYSNGSESLLFSNTDTIPNKFKIILNAHLDVVTGASDQFNPQIKHNRLYGRGAYDMKAASAVEILVFKQLAKNLDYPIGLQIVTDEEQGGFDGTKHQLDKGIKTDFALVGESSCKLNIKHKAKGIAWLDIEFTGQGAHSAYPWEGNNAIIQATNFINQVYQLIPKPQKETNQTTINVAKIGSNNDAYNKVPDHCLVSLDIRFAPEDESSIISSIQALLPKTAHLTIKMNEAANFTDPEHPLIYKLVSACNKHHINPQLIGAHGGSDMRFYSAVGSNGIEFGPIGEGAHETNEWVDIPSLVTYYKILNQWLQDL